MITNNTVFAVRTDQGDQVNEAFEAWWHEHYVPGCRKQQADKLKDFHREVWLRGALALAVALIREMDV